MEKILDLKIVSVTFSKEALRASQFRQYQETPKQAFPVCTWHLGLIKLPQRRKTCDLKHVWRGFMQLGPCDEELGR